jgi:type II restriction enzyme
LNPKNKGLIKIDRIDLPEGPIRIKRCDPSKGETFTGKKSVPISSHMIWRLANAIRSNQPVNVDRILGASYNTRSVLESLLAHTPQFYYCYPGRIESVNTLNEIKKGHKHLLWNPENPHENGVAEEIKTDIVISEIPALEAYYDALVLPSDLDLEAIDIDIKRRHAQIQIALYFIGKQLGFRTWIAQNDKGILYQNKRIGEFDGVIARLDEEALIKSHHDAVKAALLIDCIWFKNGRLMPAVMEIEHSTGVTSGLTRMKNFYDRFPPFPTRYVIVAPDEDRQKVVQECNKPQFSDLKAKYFPYSAVEELYALCQKRKLKGVTEEFLDCYMEQIVN